jgi:hypothetical protein
MNLSRIGKALSIKGLYFMIKDRFVQRFLVYIGYKLPGSAAGCASKSQQIKDQKTKKATEHRASVHRPLARGHFAQDVEHLAQRNVDHLRARSGVLLVSAARFEVTPKHLGTFTVRYEREVNLTDMSLLQLI